MTSRLAKGFPFIAILLFWGLTLPAQGLRNNNLANYTPDSLFEVNQMALTELINNLTSNLSTSYTGESFDDLLLNKETAINYTRKIYQNTDYQADEKFQSAVASFYLNKAQETSLYLKKYQAVLDKIELYKYLERYGSTRNMEIITLLLNMHLKGGSMEALKLNIISTALGYKILNIEN